MRPVVGLLLLIALQHTATAQEKPDAAVRMLYSPKNLAAGKLQATLEKHYEGVSAVKFVHDSPANVLSIRAANQPALDDALKTIATLDKTPRSIAFQALIIDAAAAGEGGAAVELDRAQLTGAADATLKIARGWIREGKVARVRTFHWTGLENQVSEDTAGEIVPRMTGVTTTVRGQFPIYSDTNVGTIFSVIPKITEANEIICEFIYNHSELDAAPAADKKPDGGFVPSRIFQARAQSTLNIPSGRSAVIVAREAGPEGPASLVVLSASITNPNAPLPPPAPPTTPPRGFSSTVASAPESRAMFATSFSSAASSLLLSQFRSEEFGKAVKLTDEQKKKLEDLAPEYDKLTEEMRTKLRESSPRDQESAQAMSALSTKRRELYERAAALLNAEQQTAFDKFADEYRTASRSRARDAGFSSAIAEANARGPGAGNRDRLTSINRLIEQRPNEPRYLLMRAQVYASDEKWDESAADYRKVLELDPRNLAALTDLAAVLVLRGDEAGFRKFAEQLLERFGNEASPAEKLRVADACLLRPEWLTNTALPESLLAAAIEGIPEEAPQPRARVDIAAAPFGVGAVTATGTSSTSDDVLVATARLHILRGQADDAIKLLQPFLDRTTAGTIRPRNDVQISAWCSMAVAQLSKGSPDAAASAIAQARGLPSQAGRSIAIGSGSSTFELTSKVRLQRTEEILREAGAKPAAAK